MKLLHSDMNSNLLKIISEDIEMSPLPGKEGDQEMETETANDRIADYSHDQENKIEDYYHSLKDKTLLEALQFQRENFFENPETDANVDPLTLKKRTIKDAIKARVMFFMR